MKRLAIFTALLAPVLVLGQGGMERRDGFVPLLWNAEQGKIYFELTEFDKDLLYYTSVGKGSGSGSTGLEWAGGGGGGVIQFHRAGPKVLVVQKNLGFRAPAGNAELAQNVEMSFPESVLASLNVVSATGGKVVVDATNLLMRDAVGFTRPGRRGPGGGAESGARWQFDASRSAYYLPKTKAFPVNSEVEIIATYAAQGPGARTAPDPSTLTVRLHHSFLKPPEGYTPRQADPRIGVGSVRFVDYSTPFQQDPQVELVRRFRLEKKNPGAAISEPKQPLIYYLDPAIPEPVRTAMKEGILWWNKAFEAAGFRNAIEVRLRPLDMDPMDARYNQVMWVNRDERGYSTGGALTDPRTGEIMAARVRMDSDRMRTASRYWQAYMPTSGGGDHLYLPPATYGSPDSEPQLVQLRQALLAAHEVGHSLGFGHNWNSSMNGRASVMEYPSPRLRIVNGKLDLTDAYQKEIGAYDIAMARYSYSEFPPAQEKAGLEAVIAEMRKQGLMFTPSTDPRWNRYDDLGDPAEYLREAMAQRKLILAKYGPDVLQAGEPYGNLRGMRLWMAYLHHRWAIDSGARYVGGMFHNFAVKGDSLPPTEIVPAAKQREILGLLLEALEPVNLAIPERILASLTVPVDGGFGRASAPDLENFEMPTAYAFDHLSAAKSLASLVIDPLLEADKAARLISFADRQPGALTLPEVIDAILAKAWAPPPSEARLVSLQRQTQRVSADALMMLAANPAATAETKAVVLAALGKLRGQVAERKHNDAVTEAHLRQVERDLARFLQNPSSAPKKSAPAAPVMAPI